MHFIELNNINLTTPNDSELHRACVISISFLIESCFVFHKILQNARVHYTTTLKLHLQLQADLGYNYAICSPGLKRHLVVVTANYSPGESIQTSLTNAVVFFWDSIGFEELYSLGLDL